MQSELTDSNYRRLAAAIIRCAVHDYIIQGKIVALRGEDLNTSKKLAETRNFFQSQWGELLMAIVDKGLTADGIISTLNHRLERYAKKKRANLGLIKQFPERTKNEERDNR